MRRILFVDDDQQVLDGLQNTLRKERKVWDMVFALGSSNALGEIQKAEFDVVVSDMRMPGMDGAEFLARVKELSPRSARIILSGQSDRESVVRALAVAHQFMDKPCDGVRLRAVIDQACEMQAMLQDPSIQDVVGRLDRLPSVPEIYWELSKALAREETGANDIAAIIEKDPAMSIKLLQIVNSAYFGLAQRVNSISQAVNYLGAELIRALVLTARIFTADEGPVVPGFSVQKLQHSSLLTARLCRSFMTDSARSSEAFTAGLLHDVGKILLAQSRPDRMAEAIRLAAETARPLHVVERELFGVNHASVGAYLLGIWGIQPAVLEAVAHHHEPSASPGSPNPILAVVHAADCMVDESCGWPGAPTDRGLDVAYLKKAGFEAQIDTWRDAAAKCVVESNSEARDG